MTKKEAIKYADFHAIGNNKEEVDNLINIIYSDFDKLVESRTCENCVNYIILDSESVLNCTIWGEIKTDNGIDYNFGCNKWESR